MKTYAVTDFHLATALITLGYALIDIDRTDRRRQVLQFEYTPEIEKDADDFFQDKLLLNPRANMSNARLLKERLRGI